MEAIGPVAFPFAESAVLICDQAGTGLLHTHDSLIDGRATEIGILSRDVVKVDADPLLVTDQSSVSALEMTQKS